ncbi:stress responsive A/B barrel domain-containing protein [Thamnocephalis sphaerospora]|uniref:Stress responsive A/B barrel domain-containing protein n=1 Tax=Thamnocephalis sphaerospora TaxID=78915 RepID=A0A4P9XIN4_9FUNG|nr:stress responsive A/B barrel domain-containing protein [Thamnocephalis sphaerospora]|eukprot:RKP05221.1 stress responsive A/B barrel domain-containing protein [Thamnocephalis sphaerospora]
MAVIHIVLIKFKPEATTSERQALMTEMNTLRDIPCVRSLSFGENFTHRSEGYTHALVVGVETKDDVVAYMIHPIHQAFSAKLATFAESRLAVDFEDQAIPAAASI